MIVFLAAASLRGITVVVEPGDDIGDSLLTLAHGDTLFLMPGVYTDSEEQPLLTAEPLQSGVIITSMPFNRAVLDGQNIERSVVNLLGPHEYEVVLENLVITGGNATGSAGFNGGGIFASESNALISNCLITDNDAFFGGGIGAEGGTLQLQYSILSSNEAMVTGGGVNLYACDFTGFMLKFLSNTSSDDGGGLNSYQSMLDLSNSLFMNNYSGDDGGAIAVLQGISHFSFLTIHLNEAFDDGGGMRLHTFDSVSVVSSIITSNMGKGGINVINGPDPPYISHVCCWDNTFANYWGMDDPTGMEGNVSEDPLYADDELNLSQIAAGQPVDSPALDAGHEPAVESTIEGFSTRTDSVLDENIADMGFHHLSNGQSGIPREFPSGNFLMTVMPSPSCGSVAIVLSSNISSAAVIQVYDVSGRLIHASEILQIEDEASYIWHPDDSYSGVFLLKAVWPWGTSHGRVVLLR